MDRDKRWERTKLAYDAIVARRAGRRRRAPARRSRRPTTPASPTSSSSRTSIVGADGKPVGPIRDGDSVVLFNFRADRVRQIVRALALDDFDGFDRAPGAPDASH